MDIYKFISANFVSRRKIPALFILDCLLSFESVANGRLEKKENFSLSSELKHLNLFLVSLNFSVYNFKNLYCKQTKSLIMDEIEDFFSVFDDEPSKKSVRKNDSSEIKREKDPKL